MAKIDTSKIEGYATMTDAEKLAALLAYDVPAPEAKDDGKTVSKATFDKTASELAAVKKALREKQTEEEKAASDRAEKEAADKAEREALLARAEAAEKAMAVAQHKSAFLSLGYEDKLAQETAEALADGKTDVVLKNAAAHKTALEAKIKADLMTQDKQPGGGDGSKAGDSPDVAAAKALAKAQSGGGDAMKDAFATYAIGT